MDQQKEKKMNKETKEEIIAILSEMRSDYNCFDANEEPKYRALSVAIKAINETDKVTDESFQHKYPDWYLPKLVCANVNCKYNGFRNACTCPQVRLNYRHLHTTNEGLVDVFECKNYEIQEDTTRDMTFMELMKFINEATPEEISNYFHNYMAKGKEQNADNNN